DLKLPEAESEAKFLKDAFTATAVEPHSKSVTDLLRTGEFDLLHFACHGYAEQDDISNAGLLMQGRIENGEYKEDCLTSSEAEQNRNPGGPDQNRPMVVLNACQVGRAAYKLTGIGGFATAFITGNAGAFIGTLWSVGDSPARTFTETFYSELLKGSRIANAAITAREAAREKGDATWLAYVVYGNPQAVVTR
ncbi:MAG: CHAT domain-containing protein, partial [Blastocatellia bacterium]